MTNLEVSRLVAMLVAAFQPPRWSEEAQRIYEEMLADLEFDPTKQAVARLITVARFMPTVSEIRETAMCLQHGPVRPGGEAWGDVMAAVRKVGGYEPCPDFADPIVARCVERFGWRALCFEGDGTADRARFIELYDRLAREQRLDQVSGVPLPKPLSGLAEPRRLHGPPATPKPLVAAPSPESPATAKPGGRNVAFGPELMFEFGKLPRRHPRVQWTGRVLTVEELDAELAAAPSPREQTP